jgi:hypothetical protein
MSSADINAILNVVQIIALAYIARCMNGSRTTKK